MAELNINNLELNDNVIELLPDGDYHVKVASHEVGYSQSEKFPPNTQLIVVYLEVPYISKDGSLKTGKVKEQFPVAQRMLWKIRQLVECIGMAPEKGRIKLDLEKMDGMNGIVHLTSRESSRGGEYNNVDIFYAPSKAPTVALNDEAWNRQDGFMEAADELPDFI